MASANNAFQNLYLGVPTSLDEDCVYAWVWHFLMLEFSERQRSGRWDPGEPDVWIPWTPTRREDIRRRVNETFVALYRQGKTDAQIEAAWDVVRRDGLLFWYRQLTGERLPRVAPLP